MPSSAGNHIPGDSVCRQSPSLPVPKIGSAAIRRGVDAGYWQPLHLQSVPANAGQRPYRLRFPHTQSRKCFPGRPDEFRSDLEASLDYLDRELGIQRPPFLPFPFGRTSPEMVSVVESLSLSSAVTTCAEQSITGTDSRFDLGCFSVEHCDDSRTLIAKLDGTDGALLRTMHRCLAIGGPNVCTPPGGSRRGIAVRSVASSGNSCGLSYYDRQCRAFIA